MGEILRVENLKKYFTVPKGKLCAVDGVSFSIDEGDTLGVVGESGCGKSTLGRTVIHLQDATDGSIYFEGKDITHISRREMKQVREKMQIIFQDPYSCLNPRYTVLDTVKEPLALSKRYSHDEIDRRVNHLLDMVGIENRLKMAYPHELDGGRRQRVGIARALALEPRFIVCDEPVSALDVSIQAQILNLMQDLQKENGLTYMFISHNLSVVSHISNRVCVMYLGQIVEICDAKSLFSQAMHPYTQALLSAIPSIDIHKKQDRIILKGEVSSPINPPQGCRFCSRCRYATEECKKPQSLRKINDSHYVACWKEGAL